MNISADSKSQESEVKCAKCGACVPVCPIFKATGRETLTARGRIHLLGKLTNPKGNDRFGDIISKCLLCGACRSACPRGIDVPSIIVAARSVLKQYEGESFKKKLIRQILGKPSLLKTVTSFAKIPGKKSKNFPEESGLHLRLAGVDLSIQPPAKSFIDSQKYPIKVNANQRTVLYFTGCLANHLAPDIAKSSVSLLKTLTGREAIIPAHQGCCGLAGLSAGDYNQAVILAKRNIEAFSSSEIANLPIFTSCSTCFSALRQYPALFNNDPVWQDKASQFSQRVYEFSTFLLENIEDEKTPLNEPDTEQPHIFYHDPCHLRHGYPHGPAPHPPITVQPRELLQKVTGITPVELPQGPQCCGQGGLFHLSHPELSYEIGESLLENFLKMDAQLVVTTCSGCLLKWKTSLSKTTPNVQCCHLAELLADFIL